MAYARSKEDQRRIRKLYNETRNRWTAGAWYDERKHRYVRFYSCRTPGYTKWLRRQSNKRLRRSPNIYKGKQYKKLFDYWWELD